MGKKLKNKCIIAGILIVVGVVCVCLALNMKGLTELQKSYITNFGIGLTVVSLFLLVKFIIVLSNPNRTKKAEIQFTDERLKQITTQSMAITFKISLLLESLGSIILVILNYEVGTYLNIIICIQIIIYIIFNVIISKKI